MTTVSVPDNGGANSAPVEIDDSAMFNAAMSDASPSPQPEPSPTPEPEAQPRDEQGRFAPKAAEPEAQPEPQPQPAPQPQPEAEAAIPPWRLREVSERAREAERRNAELEFRLSQLAGERKPPQEKPDFFADPDAATRGLIEAHVNPEITALRQQLVEMGKSLAIATPGYGAEKVQEAEKAFLDALTSRQLHPADYDRVVNSPNRFMAAVDWHRNQKALATVGNDPEAWFQQQLAERRKDPAFQAKLLEEIRGSVAQQPADGRPPTVQIPPSLNKVASAAPASGVAGDMSDQSLFRHAMS